MWQVVSCLLRQIQLMRVPGKEREDGRAFSVVKLKDDRRASFNLYRYA